MSNATFLTAGRGLLRTALAMSLGLAAAVDAALGREPGAEPAIRGITSLDAHWRFQRADVGGAESADFVDDAWPSVTLPHTWNAPDGEVGGAYYRGAGWYRRAIDRPPANTGRRNGRSFLEFDGAALAADVWVNGRHAGRHEGGYARFRFDVTAMLQPGRNQLAVRVDNAQLPTVAPLGGDFTVFGGLYRGVRLVETAAVHIDLLDHGGPGIAVDTVALSPAQARLAVRTRIRNASTRDQRAVLRLTLRDATGRAVVQQRQSLSLAAGSTELAATPLELAQPHLWQGVRDPYLYRLHAELLYDAAVQDAVTLPLGLRTMAVDPQRGFLLNGEPYPLRGVNYFHAGRPGRGLAVGDAEIDEDFRLLHELGANALRLVHFQHPPRAYQRADELGLVVWTEIPLNAAMHEGAAFRANLARQLSELVRQNRHHASVAVWGVGNEVYRSDDVIRALLSDLHAQAKREDPQRLTAYAHCCAADDHPMALQTDLAAYNRYWGWYDGEMADIARWADALHARMPHKPIGVGEYGAGASVLQQQDPPQRPAPGGPWHPEQYQALFHETYARELNARPWLWGHFVWLAFDHASAGRREGDQPGINDKGLITYDRRFRKDAYFLYQAHWQQEPMVHIASRRHSPRPAGTVTVKAYSNAARVTLTVNGQPVGTAEVVDRVASWPGVVLAPGRHQIEVRSDHGASDRTVWEVVP